MRELSVTVVTNQTSPYQVEFMDAVARAGEVDLRVVYLHAKRPGRSWSQPVIAHRHLILNRDSHQLAEARNWVEESGLAIFSYYQDPFAQELIRQRMACGTPWCFWGERMGVTRMAWAGALYRRWTLRGLHHSRAAIWGIGEFALERYRREFGAKRVYCNVPYFSDLSRFASVAKPEHEISNTRTVLYSGSLIPRKGVDLLAKAFAMVAPAHPRLRLLVMGEGELRPAMEARLRAVAGQVEFTGFQDWQALPEFYAKADVLCAPSRYDGWALVVPEALAAGLPVIATDRMGAALDLIKPGRSGWRITAGQLEPLCRALEIVASLPDAGLLRMAQEACKTAHAHSLESGVERFHKAVEQSLAGWG
jgi:glycosyltransferase involved in cell wall biosynthesis